MFMPPTVEKGAISVAFVRVCLSVFPSVAYMAKNSRTQRPSVPKFGRRFSTFDANRTPVSWSNGQRSWLQTGGGIPCRPNPAATLLVFACLRYIVSCAQSIVVKAHIRVVQFRGIMVVLWILHEVLEKSRSGFVAVVLFACCVTCVILLQCDIRIFIFCFFVTCIP